VADRTIKISEETYQKLKEQLGGDVALDLTSLDELVGKAWFFRTVTYHLVGKVTRRLGNFLVLSDASWVADSGRFMQAIKSGTLNEVEPVGPALLNLDTVTDAFPWVHPLPDKQK
jgi:hypothetical protein